MTFKKIILIFLVVLILGFTGTIVFKTINTSLVLSRFSKAILTNQTDSFEKNYQTLQGEFKFWKKIFFVFDKTKFSIAENIIENLPELTGVNTSKTYFILLQNNMELRPTGGFMGSYAKIKFEKGGMKDLSVQDIYVPDGQIKGHVEPPAPIQEAFQQGWFRLRDANWDPDFSNSAQTLAWFFEKGDEEKADGIIAVNLIFARDLLKITGPINLPDYNLEVDQSNFYQIAQEYSETNFFSGSTQKANIMGALVKAMLEKIKVMDFRNLVLTAKTVIKNLNENQILISVLNNEVQNNFSALGWDGSLKKNPDDPGKINDYFYLVEANLGANKANLYVNRKIDQVIEIENNDQLKKRIKILFENSSKYITPVKPGFWGGNYLNYLRLYLPKNAENISIKIGETEIPKEKLTIIKRENLGLQEIGFFITVLAKEKLDVEVSYNLAINNNNTYVLQVLKQSGVESIPFSLKIVKNKTEIYFFEEDLRSRTQIKAEI